jgi:Tfp pilus assembly protein PilF
MENTKNKGLLGYVVFTLAVIVSLGFVYSAYRLAYAEYIYGRSLIAVVQNRGNEAYNLQIKAIQLNPFAQRYRVSYSQINLALANSIASKPAKEITNQDRNTIQQLVSQAIREAKFTVGLNRLSSGNWANLANIYRNLLAVAQGAPQWSVSTYQQAIALDPNNPQLRLTYGQLLYSLNQFEAAQRQFEAAATLKPDLANAHYNLAVSLKQQEKLAQAKFQLEQTLRLVDASSDDFDTVKKELDSVVAQLAASETKEKSGALLEKKQSELTSPEETTSSAKLEPKLKLSEKEAAPETSTPSGKFKK